MRRRWRAFRTSVRSGFWAVPSVFVFAAVLLALGLERLDRSRDSTLALTFGAGPDGAREVLGAITTAMITFTGLVFSITIVVLSLTSSQFSPRVLRTFLRDRQSQISLGVFVATFVYSVMILRTVNATDENEFVPHIATTVALVLLLLSVGVFVSYIHHIATTIQVSSIIGSIAAEARDTLERRFPSGDSKRVDGPYAELPEQMPSVVVPAEHSGVITTYVEKTLVELACAADVVLVSQVAVGTFVPEGAPLFEVLGEPDELDVEAMRGCVQQARERTMEQDLEFGFRQLVDIAERALSPGVNDPTTAVQVLDVVHDLLRRLATRPLRSGVHRDEDGRPRLVLPPEGMEQFLASALDEVEHYGAESIQVQHRLAALLKDVASAALPEHRGAIDRHREAWQASKG